jgi:hypothetical protein
MKKDFAPWVSMSICGGLPHKYCQAIERAGCLNTGGAPAVTVCCCWRRPDTCWRRYCQEDHWDCLLFTEASSMRRALQWGSMKPESSSCLFLPKSSLIFSCHCLRPPMAPRFSYHTQYIWFLTSSGRSTRICVFVTAGVWSWPSPTSAEIKISGTTHLVPHTSSWNDA